MKALILAAGFGRRMRPITNRTPKPLIPLLNKPTISYILKKIPKSVDHVIIDTHYKSSLIVEYISSLDCRFEIKFIVEKNLLGTGGAIANARQYLDDVFLVLPSDVITSMDLTDFVKFHESNNALLSIAYSRIKQPGPYGFLEIDSWNRVTKYQEKPSIDNIFSEKASSSHYVLDSEIFDYLPKNRVFSFEEEGIPELLEKGVYGYEIPGFSIDIGVPASYLKAAQLIMQTYSEEFNISLGFNKNVNRGTPETRMPVCIGSDNLFEEDVSIGPNAVLGCNNVISKGTNIQNSVIMDDCQIRRNSILTDVIVDTGSVVEEGKMLKHCIVSNQQIISF